MKVKLNNGLPAVSIGMPVYNGERFIRKALDSLLAQTFAEFELIISDNASTDATPEICKEYAAKDPRVRYIRQPKNKGPSRNFEIVAKEARADFFCWLAYDDYWDKDYLDVLFKSISSVEDVVLCYGNTILVDENGKEGDRVSDKVIALDDSSLKRFFRSLDSVYAYRIYGIWRRSHLLSLFPITNVGHADDQLLLHLAALKGKIMHIDFDVFYCRQVRWDLDVYNERLIGKKKIIFFKEFKYLKNGVKVIYIRNGFVASLIFFAKFFWVRRELLTNEFKFYLIKKIPGLYAKYKKVLK